MSKGLNGLVYTDVPPMPNTSMVGSSFPTSAPPNNNFYAQAVCDMESMVSLTHNSSTASLSFTLLAWSDICGWWIPYATQACAQYAQIAWKVFVNTPIYIYASAGLGANTKVVLGGVSLQGNKPIPFAGE